MGLVRARASPRCFDRHSTRLVAWLGEVGMLVMTRLMAFILLCIGIQIMSNGVAELLGIAQ